MDGHGVVDLPGVAAGHGDGDGQAAPPAFAQHELVPGGEAGLGELEAAEAVVFKRIGAGEVDHQIGLVAEDQCQRVVEGGVKITSVNIGGMAFRQGKTQVNNAISVDAKDIEAFNKLNARGIELEARKVSTDPKLKMMDLIAKVDK